MATATKPKLLSGFAIEVKSYNGTQICNYLGSLGYKRGHLSGTAGNGYFYWVKTRTKDVNCDNYDNLPNNIKKYTLEQFKALHNTTSKTISHYTPKNKYQTLDIANALGTTQQRVREFPLSGILFDKAKRLGLLELWFEPVYKQPEVKIRMGKTFDVVVKNGRVFHNNDDITLFVTQLTSKFEPFLNKRMQIYGGYIAIVDEVTFKKTGCRTCKTTITEWNKVAEIMKLQQTKK